MDTETTVAEEKKDGAGTGQEAKPDTQKQGETADDVMKNIMEFKKPDETEPEKKDPPRAGTTARPSGEGSVARDVDKIEGETEVDRAGLEKIPKDAQQAIIRERIKLRKEREALAREPTPARDTRSPSQEGSLAGERTGLKREDVAFAFNAARRALGVLNGGFDEKLDEPKAKAVLKNFQAFCTELSDPAMLMQLRDAALAGKLEGGEELAGLIEKEIPRAQQRLQLAQTAQTQEAEQQKTKLAEIGTEFKKVYENFPEFKPPAEGQPASKEFSFAAKYLQEELTDFEKERIFAEPAREIPRVMKRIKQAWLADQADVIRAERDTLKKTIDAAKGPLAGGGAGETQEGQKESDKVKQEIAERFNVKME